jgi:hypothetical protein
VPYDAEVELPKGVRSLNLIADALTSVSSARLILEAFTSENACGTTHCALGWAVVKHREELGGFYFSRDGDLCIKGHKDGLHHWWTAAANELGLSVELAVELFGGDNSVYTEDGRRPTTKQVIDRLRAEATKLAMATVD